MNYTMENAIRYLPKPCAQADEHDQTSGCYDCVRAYYSNEQGTTAIAKALIAEGFPAFVEQVSGWQLEAVVHGSNGKALGCNAESGVIFYDSYLGGGINLNDPLEFRPSFYGCTEETLELIIQTVEQHQERLKLGADIPLFTEGA